MTIEEFWNIIGKLHRESSGDFDKKCELLDAELRKLPLAEVRSFDPHFTECLDRAYTWELWAAAYIMGSGCPDDGFWDFRSTLISMGCENHAQRTPRERRGRSSEPPPRFSVQSWTAIREFCVRSPVVVSGGRHL